MAFYIRIGSSPHSDGIGHWHIGTLAATERSGLGVRNRLLSGNFDDGTDMGFGIDMFGCQGRHHRR